MIMFHWVSAFRWKPRIKFYKNSIGWCLEFKWLWYQLSIYSTRIANLVTKILNRGIDQYRGISQMLITREELDAEIDKVCDDLEE